MRITAGPWWRHQMEAFSASLVLCEGILPFNATIPLTKAGDAVLWCAAEQTIETCVIYRHVLYIPFPTGNSCRIFQHYGCKHTNGSVPWLWSQAFNSTKMFHYNAYNHKCWSHIANGAAIVCNQNDKHHQLYDSFISESVLSKYQDETERTSGKT